ncbi:MAG: hypothetical protein DRI89_13885 [Bacteroidetes bacterium]|nr:MAG: hypothetical protein DRI89_13885 [Bacteroidota bacterium]
MIKKRIFGFLFILSLVLLTSSCDQNNKSTKPRSIGNTSEILVVLDSQKQWDNTIGKTIRTYFEQEQYGLNQVEPIFKLAHISKQNFSDLFKKHRNILIVHIDPKIEKSKVESFEDLWSSPQQIINIHAPNNRAFVSTLNENATAIIDKYNLAERKRILSVFRPSSRNKVSSEIAETFQLKMTVPSGFFMAKNESDFMWIRKEANEYSQCIFIISEPYKDTAQFSTSSIVARTNRFLEQYVPGDQRDSFMQIDEEFVIPQGKIIENFVSGYAIELRGLWNVEGDFMGGPFLSYTFLDSRSNKIVTLHSYVYHPNKKKRDLLRQLESILYSTQFTK